MVITIFQPHSHYLLNKMVLLPRAILDIKRYHSEINQHHLKIISKILKELYKEDIKKFLKLIQRTYINITNKDFLNMSKLINAIKGSFKEKLDLF